MHRDVASNSSSNHPDMIDQRRGTRVLAIDLDLKRFILQFTSVVHVPHLAPTRIDRLPKNVQRYHQERFHWNMGKAPNGERVVAFKGDSLESLAGLVARGLTSSFDVVYVDASHEVSLGAKQMEEGYFPTRFSKSMNASPTAEMINTVPGRRCVDVNCVEARLTGPRTWP